MQAQFRMYMVHEGKPTCIALLVHPRCATDIMPNTPISVPVASPIVADNRIPSDVPTERYPVMSSSPWLQEFWLLQYQQLTLLLLVNRPLQ